MTRHARLALAENLRDFAYRQFHRRDQAHDPQTGRIGQGAKGGFGIHEGHI